MKPPLFVGHAPRAVFAWAKTARGACPTSIAALFLAAPALAQDAKKLPRLHVVSPVWVTAGGTVKLTLRGSNLDGLTAVTVGDPKSAARLLDKPKKAAPPNQHPADREGDSEVTIELKLAKELPPTLTLTAVGPGGPSNALRVAVADDAPRTAEKEPNDGFANAQPVPAVGVVEGAIGRDRDVDVYRFDGTAGQTLRVEVWAARFGSPLDAVLSVYDADRRLLATADDADGSPDPAVTLTLPRAGAYYVTVLDAHDLGAGYFTYRLRVGAGR